MTVQTIKPAPVRKTVRVNASPERAFDVFTRGITRWWPASHTMLKSPLKETIIEPFVKGRWYQVGEDGSECDTGHVLVWQPPMRLVLAWQLNADWQFDPELLLEVEVTFTAEDAHTTRVDLEHRNLEQMGDRAEAVRSQVDSANGWTGILEAYRQSASR
jgi:uncharacterized protein YndB with AHSA1/START domain